MRSLVALAVLMLIAAALPAQCTGLGGAFGVPQITATSNLWDSDTEFRISSAKPGAAWALLLDVVPGPTPSPWGPFCVGPGAIVIADSFGGLHPPVDANGEATFGGPLDIPGLIGVPLHLQALVVDSSAPFNLARSDGFEFTVRAPRVYATSGGHSIDILDGRALGVGAAPGVDSFPAQGDGEIAVSPDGNTLFVRGDLSTPVHAFDVGTAPANYLGGVSLALSGIDRPGIAVSPDGSAGWFLSSGELHRFDADPSSPGFLSVTNSIPLSMIGVQGIALASDGSLAYVVGGQSPSPMNPSFLCVVDTSIMLEVATVNLTDSPLLLGFAIREPVEVSPDGRWVATLQQGAHPFSGSGINVVGAQPGFPTFLAEVAHVNLPNTNQIDIAFSPDGFTIYTVDRDAAGAMFLTAVDWAAGTTTSVPLGVNTPDPSNFFGSVDLTPNGAFIYVASGANDEIQVFDANLNQVSSFVVPSAGTVRRLRVEAR